MLYPNLIPTSLCCNKRNIQRNEVVTLEQLVFLLLKMLLLFIMTLMMLD